MKLLCLSNGHGEDAIAVQILKSLRNVAPDSEIAALPLVGEGRAYERAGVPIVGEARTLPSGGFIYMDAQQWWRDMQGGLVGLTWSQLRAVRAWVQAAGPTARVLAVGDIVPLLFAWWSGAPYGFVGTAKSEYYLRDDAGNLLRSRWSEAWSGSVYLPWERWLLGRSRCRAIFPRDGMTSEILARCLRIYGAADRVFTCGNPMMDGFTVPAAIPADSVLRSPGSRPETVLILPGSRSPEALANWRRLLSIVQVLLDPADRPLTPDPAATPTADRPIPWRFLAAISPGFDRSALAESLRSTGWQPAAPPSIAPTEDLTNDPGTLADRWLWPSLTAPQAECLLAIDQFVAFAEAADWAIAMAGTATEQVVGLGKPVLTITGEGPQFTPAFAEAQTRLLGRSVTLIDQPEAARSVLARWQQEPGLVGSIAENGRRRLGSPGAADRIATTLRDRFSPEP